MDDVEIVARALCREKCAFMGEPPCFVVMDGSEYPFPPETCSEPGCMAEATAAITALRASGWQKVGPDQVVVPVEPTTEMNAAGYMQQLEQMAKQSGWSAKKNSDIVYRAMIAARPKE